MPRPRQVSDEDILAAARDRFLAHGPQASMQAIAQQLGVSEAALFKRFGTKQGLLLAALAPAEPPFLGALEAGPDGRPIREQLTELFSAMADHFDQSLPCWAVLRASGVDDHELLRHRDGSAPLPLRLHRALAAWLRDAMARGRVRPVEASSVATLILGALHSHAFLGRLPDAGVAPAAEHARALVDVVWGGIRPEESR